MKYPNSKYPRVDTPASVGEMPDTAISCSLGLVIFSKNPYQHVPVTYVLHGKTLSATSMVEACLSPNPSPCRCILQPIGDLTPIFTKGSKFIRRGECFSHSFSYYTCYLSSILKKYIAKASKSVYN